VCRVVRPAVGGKTPECDFVVRGRPELGCGWGGQPGGKVGGPWGCGCPNGHRAPMGVVGVERGGEKSRMGRGVGVMGGGERGGGQRGGLLAGGSLAGSCRVSLESVLEGASGCWGGRLVCTSIILPCCPILIPSAILFSPVPSSCSMFPLSYVLCLDFLDSIFFRSW